MRDGSNRDRVGTQVPCATCRRDPAKWLAKLDPTIGVVRGTEAETWPVCDRCRNQAERLTVLVTHEPLVAS